MRLFRYTLQEGANPWGLNKLQVSLVLKDAVNNSAVFRDLGASPSAIDTVTPVIVAVKSFPSSGWRRVGQEVILLVTVDDGGNSSGISSVPHDPVNGVLGTTINGVGTDTFEAQSTKGEYAIRYTVKGPSSYESPPWCPASLPTPNLPEPFHQMVTRIGRQMICRFEYFSEMPLGMLAKCSLRL